MAISTAATIVIVIVVALGAVSLAAAISRTWNRSENSRYRPHVEQDHYMRTVRRRNYDRLRRVVNPREVNPRERNPRDDVESQRTSLAPLRCALLIRFSYRYLTANLRVIRELRWMMQAGLALVD